MLRDRLFAEGIPFRLGEGVNMPNVMIHGASDDPEHEIQTSSLSIDAAASMIVGGYMADMEGEVSMKDVSIELGPDGSTEMIFGGSLAYSQSSSSVENVDIKVAGFGKLIYCGSDVRFSSYAEQTGKCSVEILPGGDANYIFPGSMIIPYYDEDTSDAAFGEFELSLGDCDAEVFEGNNVITN